MLRYKEKEDLDARFVEVDEVVEAWRERRKDVARELEDEFREKLMMSLIYHDAALEGDVLSHSEIKAATDASIISDASLIPCYEDVTHFHAAATHAFEFAKSRRKTLKLDTIKEIYAALAGEPVSSISYRKENPLHRLYYHEISPPEKIAYRMRKYGEWLDSSEARSLHPIDRAARTHYKLMAIFPWTQHTGRAARIISNLLLEQSNYPLAVIHSIDRQRYYESLRASDTKQLLSVYLEAVETTAASALRVYDEAATRHPRKRRRAS